MKRFFRIAGLILALVLVIALGLALKFILPGTPDKAASLRFIGYVPLPKTGTISVLDYMAVYGDQLYVAGMSGGNVSKLHLNRNTLPQASQPGLLDGKPETHGVVLDSASGMAFVSRSEENVVDVFDPVSMHFVTSITVPDDPDGIFFDPRTRQVYVASGDGQMGTIIDPAKRAIVQSIPLGGKPEYATLDPETKLLYQNVKSTNEVVSIDLDKHAIVNRWKVPGCEGPSGQAIDVANRQLFVACSANAKVAVFDLRSHAVTTTLPIGDTPDSIAFDAGLHRLYSAGKSGVSTVIQQDAPAAYHVVDNIHTHYGAHTLTVDPATHRVYIGYAGIVAAPRIAVFEAVQ